MAGGTADLVEQMRAALRLRRGRQLRIPRRSLAGTDESGKVIQIVEPVGGRRVIGFVGRVAQLGDLVGKEPRRNAHLVQVSVAGKGKQAGVLVLPPKAAYAGLPRRF